MPVGLEEPFGALVPVGPTTAMLLAVGYGATIGTLLVGPTGLTEPNDDEDAGLTGVVLALLRGATGVEEAEAVLVVTGVTVVVGVTVIVLLVELVTGATGVEEMEAGLELLTGTTGAEEIEALLELLTGATGVEEDEAMLLELVTGATGVDGVAEELMTGIEVVDGVEATLEEEPQLPVVVIAATEVWVLAGQFVTSGPHEVIVSTTVS